MASEKDKERAVLLYAFHEATTDRARGQAARALAAAMGSPLAGERLDDEQLGMMLGMMRRIGLRSIDFLTMSVGKVDMNIRDENRRLVVHPDVLGGGRARIVESDGAYDLIEIETGPGPGSKGVMYHGDYPSKLPTCVGMMYPKAGDSSLAARVGMHVLRRRTGYQVTCLRPLPPNTKLYVSMIFAQIEDDEPTGGTG